jgi:hypothetical protein
MKHNGSKGPRNVARMYCPRQYHCGVVRWITTDASRISKSASSRGKLPIVLHDSLISTTDVVETAGAHSESAWQSFDDARGVAPISRVKTAATQMVKMNAAPIPVRRRARDNQAKVGASADAIVPSRRSAARNRSRVLRPMRPIQGVIWTCAA